MEPIEFLERNGDTLTVSKQYDNTLCFEIDEPFAGDTMTGIGRSCAYSMTKDQVVLLVQKLTEFIENT